MKKTLYYKDVPHSCGHVVRYEFSISKDASKEKRTEMSQELARMATEPCGPCQENKNVNQNVESVA